MKSLLRNLELILTAAGVLVVFVIFAIFRDAGPWKPAAICAVAVGVIHGILFYLVRSKQRKARNSEVFSIRDMLDDVLKNRLTTVLYPPDMQDDWRTRAQLAVWEIQTRLNYIEAESFQSQKLD
jgi:hypothetical protein